MRRCTTYGSHNDVAMRVLPLKRTNRMLWNLMEYERNTSGNKGEEWEWNTRETGRVREEVCNNEDPSHLSCWTNTTCTTIQRSMMTVSMTTTSFNTGTGRIQIGKCTRLQDIWRKVAIPRKMEGVFSCG